MTFREQTMRATPRSHFYNRDTVTQSEEKVVTMVSIGRFANINRHEIPCSAEFFLMNYIDTMEIRKYGR